jgi:hypothetical protein
MVEAIPIVMARMLHTISFFLDFHLVFHRIKHMRMSLIILPEEQKCSPKEQIAMPTSVKHIRYDRFNPCFELYKREGVVTESTREHKRP